MAAFTASLIFGTTALTTSQLIIGGLVFAGGSALISSALMPKMEGAGGSALSTTVDPIGTTDLVYGEVRMGGVKTYHETTSNGKFYHYFITLALHQVNAIGDIYINDEVATINASGLVTSGEWNSKILIKKFTGAATQDIYTSLQSIADKPSNITSAFKGAGVACLYVRLEYDQDVFRSGMPMVTAVVQGRKLYDPRKDSTSTAYNSSLGVSSHRKSNPATWEYSNNPVLALRDYLTSSLGCNTSYNDIDDNMLAVAVYDCASTGVGTENSFEINGLVSTGESKRNNVLNIMKCFNGTIFWAQGKYRISAGAYHDPVASFNLDDIRGPITVKPRYSRRDMINTVRGTFTNRDARWIEGEFPQVQLASLAEDGGIESTVDLDLKLVTKSSQAQRLAKQVLYTSREQIVVSARFSTAAFEVQVGDRIQLSIDRYGWTDKVFLVLGWKLVGGGDTPLEIEMMLKEDSSTVYQWSISSDEYRDLILNNTWLDGMGSNLTVTSLAVSSSYVQKENGVLIGRIAISWTAPINSAVVGYEVQWKENGQSNYTANVTTLTGFLIEGLESGATYNIRVRGVTYRNNKGPWATINAVAQNDTVAPAKPTSQSATGGFKYIEIKWTNPADKDLSHIEVYENTTNSTTGATLVGTSSGSNYVRSGLGLGVTRWYFLKAVDYSGNKSGYTTGVSGTSTFVDDASFENGVYQIFKDAGLYAIRDVTTLPTSGAFTGEKVFNKTDNKLYQWTGTAWQPSFAKVNVADISGKITNAQIAVNAIQGDVIAASAITATKIGTDAVEASKIKAGAVIAGKIAADAVTASTIATGAVTADAIAANAVTANAIAANTITANEIKGNTITGDKIVANTITGGLLATSGIITSTAQINNAVIDATKIKDAAIENAKIKDGAITTAKIGNLQVDSAKIKDLTVGTTKITDNAVTGKHYISNISQAQIQHTGDYVLFINSYTFTAVGDYASIAFNYTSGWSSDANLVGIYVNCPTFTAGGYTVQYVSQSTAYIAAIISMTRPQYEGRSATGIIKTTKGSSYTVRAGLVADPSSGNVQYKSITGLNISILEYKK